MSEAEPLRILIADDEPLSRDKIRGLLKGDREVQIVAECATGREVLLAIPRVHPDLLFLDIQMPDMTGLEALEEMKSEQAPYVILVTAYDQYAVRAFEYSALDYLLKPFDRERFLTALQKAKSRIRSEHGRESIAGIATLLRELHHRPSYRGRFPVKGKDGSVLLLRDIDIDWIDSEGNYVRLHSGKQRFMIRQTLAALEAELDPKRFLRIHRSTIVNLDRVKELKPLFRGDYQIALEDGTRLTLSRAYRKDLQERLGGKL